MPRAVGDAVVDRNSCRDGIAVKPADIKIFAITDDLAAGKSYARSSDILSGKAKPADMAIQAQKEFKPTINLKEAAKIGLKVPEDLLKGADVIK